MYKYIFIVFVLIVSSCSELKNNTQSEIIEVTISDEKNTNTENSVIELESENSITEEKELDFNTLDDHITLTNNKINTVNADNYWVICNNETDFYSYINLETNNDTKKLKKEFNIPIGSIVTNLKEIVIKNTIHQNYFKFLGDYNYFYELEYNGSKGIIWGAGLSPKLTKKNEAERLSYNYLKKSKSETFLNYNGNYEFNKKIVQNLELDNIAFEEIKNSIDMIDLYYNDSKVNDNSIFITTDLLMYSYNNLWKNIKYDYIKADIIPDLITLFKNIIKVIEKNEEEDSLKYKNYTNTIKLTKDYFYICLQILDENKDIKMSNTVLNEIDLIKNKIGYSKSPYSEISIDYTKLKYENPYELLINWMNITDLKVSTILYINKLMNDDLSLYNSWFEINNKLVKFNKKSNNLSLNKTLPLIDEFIFSIFPSWLEENENINELILKNNLQSMKFNFFNIPLNYDDMILNEANGIDINSQRSNILDLMENLGSKTAKKIIEQKYSSDNNPEIPDFNAFIESNLDYNQKYLNLISSLFSLEQNKKYLFTEKGKWNQKVLNSASAGYVEYKNTNYYKLNREIEDIANKKPNDLTYNRIDLVEPYHYIEPNNIFYKTLHKLLLDVDTDFNSYLDDINKLKLKEFILILETIIEIVQLEEKDLDISENQNSFISDIPQKLMMLIDISTPSISYLSNHSIATGVPRRIYVAIDNESGGKRVATGYTYSYYEFTNTDNETVSAKDWINNFETGNLYPKKLLPFWLENI